MKGNACERVGMNSLKVELPESTTTEELLTKISELNANPEVSGILLQHPVPEQIDERICFDAINVDDYRKKVDFIPLAKSKINTLKLNIINLDKDYEQNNLKNIFSLIKSKNQICILITKDIKKNKNIIDLKFEKIFNIKDTNLNVICY